MAKIITIASGKGGVGKTSISLNLALSLAGSGFKVCLFDADLGLANVNILTGLYPESGLAEVIEGEMILEDIMIRDFNGIDIIPGSSGVEKLADLSRSQAGRLIKGFLDLADYDYFILDTSAGISSQVLSFCRASQEMILVVTPEPTSLTDAYSLIKVLSRETPMPRVRVVVNQVRTASSAKQAYAKLKKTVHKFLSVPISPLGIVARDGNVPIAVVSQIPFFMLFPDCKASRCIRSIAMKLVEDFAKADDMPVEMFWDNCLTLISREKTDETPRGEAGDEKGTPHDFQASHQALERRLDQMEEKISAILEEISGITALLAQKETRPPEDSLSPEPALSASPVTKEPPQIPLDFEAWLAARTGNMG